jgi:hypothetical protein
VIAIAAVDGLLINKLIPPKLRLEPDHLVMWVSLDGEFDEYYEELKLICNGLPVKADKIIWTSEDPDIAEVDKDGWVTSMKVGETGIKANYRGKTAECRVRIKRKITSDTLGE